MRNDEYKIRNRAMYCQDITASEATALLDIIDALRAELTTAMEAGAKEERARIVEWMRLIAKAISKNSDFGAYDQASIARDEAASAIEVGEHLEGDEQTCRY